MYKKLLFGDEARQALVTGIDIVANAVTTTLGPKGRNVAMARKWQVPNVVHDGVSVAKEINLRNPFQQIGAMLVREAASKTNDLAGDGTTTATLIAQKITHEGIKAINSGSNPMIIRFGIEKAIKAVIAELNKIATQIESKEEAKQVATVSSGFEDIGEKISEAINKVGKDGVVTVERGSSREIEVEYKEGMSLERGYASPFFSTNLERMEAEVENPRILITDEKLSSIHDIEKFFEMFLMNKGRELVIIADEVEGDALATIVVNTVKHKLIKCIALKSPGFGDRRKEMLQDIASLVGANVISRDSGRSMQEVTMEDLGMADKVWADKDETRIIGGKGNREDVEKRIKLVKNQIAKTTNDFDREKLEERLSKLTGGAAQINVGASTETELKEKLERVRDAVGATKAAMEEGIVPGGGVALLRAREVLKSVEGDNKDETIGIQMVYDALSAPIYKLMSNAGLNGEHVSLEILKNKDVNFGYDVLKDTYGSMIEMGIIDPVKVTKGALQNGASVAMMILTTEALIAPDDVSKDIPDESEI